jgi:hypothetical protein
MHRYIAAVLWNTTSARKNSCPREWRFAVNTPGESADLRARFEYGGEVFSAVDGVYLRC